MNIWMIDAVNMTPYYNASLCRALLEEGCRVRMMTSPFIYDPWPIYQGIPTELCFSRFMNRRLLLGIAGKARMRRMLRALEYPIDLLQAFLPPQPRKPILHFQWPAVPVVDVWVWRWLKRAGYALALTVHNILPHDAGLPPVGQRQLYELPERLIVHTPSLAEELCECFPDTAHRVRVIPHGTLFEDVPELTLESARTALGLSLDQRVILFLGLIRGYKGVECLIRAFSAVKRAIPDAQLLIIGKPDIPVEPYHVLIRELGLANAVHTRFEFIPTEEVPQYFGAADLVVLPYLEASQSGVLLAAYRFGCAVVVTDTGGLPDTVEHGKNGYVVPPGDEEALAGAIIEILADPARAKAMGNRSRALGLERHNWAQIARQTMAVYQELLSS